MRSKFLYHRPRNYLEAYQLKKQYNGNAVYWSGGTDLILQWQRGLKQIEHCIDITHAEMNYIRIDKQFAYIGATTTLAELASFTSDYPQLRVLANTAAKMATPQVRTLATIGGNICNAVPSADLSAPLLALNATISTTEGEHKISDFFINVRKTVLGQDELVTEIVLPLVGLTACSYQRLTRSSVDISLAGVAASVQADEQNNISEARIALNAVAPTPVLATKAGEFIKGRNIAHINEEVLQSAAELVLSDIHPISDLRGSKEFRNYASVILTKKVLADAIFCLKKES